MPIKSGNRLITVGVLFLMWRCGEADIFTSVYKTEKSIQLHKHLLDLLDAYSGHLKVTLAHIQTFSETAKMDVLSGQGIDDIVRNPIRAFHFMQHQAISWVDLHKHIEAFESTSANIRYKLDDLMDEYDRAKEEDVHGLAYALARIQLVYNLSLPEMQFGILEGVPTGVNLSIRDMYQIAEAAFVEKAYGSSIRWLEHLLPQVTAESDFGKSVQGLLENATLEFDDAMLTEDSVLFVNDRRFPIRKQGPLPEYKLEQVSIGDIWGHGDEVKMAHKYIELCQAKSKEEKLSVKPSNLTCRYSDRGSTYLKLQPVKMEHLHPTEPVFLFHDFIRDQDIHTLKDLANHYLDRAEVGSNDEGAVSQIRTAQNFFLGDSEPERLSHLISETTKLNAFPDTYPVGGAESLQIANYGIGGHYATHKDCDSGPFEEIDDSDYDRKFGKRLATFMMYLSGGTTGGSTVFPHLNLAIRPEKGAAILWYNTFPDGYCSRLYTHASCPMILGDKWVANKWIRYRAQKWSKEQEIVFSHLAHLNVTC